MTDLLILIGGSILAILSALIYGRLSGAKAERNANRAKEADAYERSLEEIAAANRARNSVSPDRLPDDDPYRRD